MEVGCAIKVTCAVLTSHKCTLIYFRKWSLWFKWPKKPYLNATRFIRCPRLLGIIRRMKIAYNRPIHKTKVSFLTPGKLVMYNTFWGRKLFHILSFDANLTWLNCIASVPSWRLKPSDDIAQLMLRGLSLPFLLTSLFVASLIKVTGNDIVQYRKYQRETEGMREGDAPGMAIHGGKTCR